MGVCNDEAWSCATCFVRRAVGVVAAMCVMRLQRQPRDISATSESDRTQLRSVAPTGCACVALSLQVYTLLGTNSMLCCYSSSQHCLMTRIAGSVGVTFVSSHVVKTGGRVLLLSGRCLPDRVIVAPDVCLCGNSRAVADFSKMRIHVRYPCLLFSQHAAPHSHKGPPAPPHPRL